MRAFTHRSPHGSNKGVVLIVVMIMLVLIGFMSAAVMRGAINSDQVSNNNRAQMQATEAAQLALRFCEEELRKAAASAPLITIAAAPPDAETPMLWTNKASWTGGGVPQAIKVPETAMKTTGMATSLRRPECLAQYAFNTTPSPVVLTARGFSGDYTETNTNQIKSGSVIWLQSTFLLQPSTPLSP